MAVKHTRLARNCQAFKGATRAIYKTIADHASPGKPKNWDPKSKKKFIPADWTNIGLARIMMENRIDKVQTVTDALKEMQEAGAIEIKPVNGRNWYRFLVEFAEQYQCAEDHLEYYRCKASYRYRTKKAREAAEAAESSVTPKNGVKNSEEITPTNGVSLTEIRCKEQELHRKTVGTTPQNGTVVHPSEVNHLSEESKSAYVDRFTTGGGGIVDLRSNTVSTETVETNPARRGSDRCKNCRYFDEDECYCEIEATA